MMSARARLLLVLTVVSVGLSVGYGVLFRSTDRAYSIDEIRSYRISKMSDQEIREAWEKSALMHSQQSNRKTEFVESLARERSEMLEKCSDLVYRERNPSKCRSPRPLVPVTDMEQAEFHHSRTRESFYLEAIVGFCFYADKEDRDMLLKYDCIPTKP